MDDQEYLQIAADMLSEETKGDTGLLSTYLSAELHEINRMCKKAGGFLRSRQLIATIIQDYRYKWPESKLYGE